jgi:DNA-binding XRE family transcriptional regulator
VAGRRRQTKQRQSRKLVTIRSIDWKLVDSVFDPLHARFNFTLEGCADDEGLNSHGDLPHCSPSDSILERDLSGERVFVNPPWEIAKQIAQHFEDCRRTSPTPMMDVFVLPKWAKFAQLTKHWKLYQEFSARTQLFTRQSPENPAQHEVVAPAPWHVQLW